MNTNLLRKIIRQTMLKERLLTETRSSTYFHMSTDKFDSFEQQYKEGWALSDVGFHFGTKDTAMAAADKLIQEGRVKSGEAVFLYSVDLFIDSSIRLQESRGGNWNVSSILRQMFEGFGGGQHPSISEEELDNYYEDIVIAPSGENIKDLGWDPQLEMEAFESWFTNLGFDSIVYDNTFEGGGDSVIVFDPSQIVINDVEEYQVP